MYNFKSVNYFVEKAVRHPHCLVWISLEIQIGVLGSMRSLKWKGAPYRPQGHRVKSITYTGVYLVFMGYLVTFSICGRGPTSKRIPHA